MVPAKERIRRWLRSKRDSLRRMVVLALSLGLLSGLPACAGGTFDPSTLVVDATSAVGQALTRVATEGTNLADKSVDALATGADYYCSNAPAIARDALRATVNLKMAAKKSKWLLGPFCLPNTAVVKEPAPLSDAVPGGAASPPTS